MGVNCDFAKSGTGSSMIVVFILSLVAGITAAIYCPRITVVKTNAGGGRAPGAYPGVGRGGSVNSESVDKCSFIFNLDVHRVEPKPKLYGPLFTILVTGVTALTMSAMFLLKFFEACKKKIKCWKITDYIVICILLLFNILALILIVVNMIVQKVKTSRRNPDPGEVVVVDSSHLTTWIASCVCLGTTVTVLIYILVGIARYWHRKEKEQEQSPESKAKTPTKEPAKAPNPKPPSVPSKAPYQAPVKKTDPQIDTTPKPEVPEAVPKKVEPEKEVPDKIEPEKNEPDKVEPEKASAATPDIEAQNQNPPEASPDKPEQPKSDPDKST